MSYTIGYERASFADFLAELRSAGVEVLFDVRAVPLSRKPGFSKKALAERLGKAGIEYIHEAQLGDPLAGRTAAREGDYSTFRRIYRAHLAKRSTKDAIDRLADLARTRTVCLMCFERDPATCHRSIIAECLEVRGLTFANLYCDAPTRDGRARESSRDFGEGATAA